MPKKSKTKSTAFKKHINRILSILNSSAALNLKQISMKLGINNPIERVEVIECLHYLMISNQIDEKRRGIYTIKTNNKYLTGIFDLTARGSGYIISNDFEEDIYIPSNKTMGALSGDEIEFYILNRKKKGRLEGEVNQILKRSKSEYVGVIQLNKNFAFVVPDDKKMPVDIYVPLKKIKNAKEGQKVLVKIIEWPSKAECPTGKVVEVLGDAGDHQTEIHAILAAYGLPYKFDKKVEDFANNLDTSITEEEIKKRRDMRQILTFTIDPKDAKDFDDALSFQILKNGNYEIGIHIADVSHYLQEGTILDDEAYERATSVYLVDRVVPMLPEVLSNNACSLRPNEEKYTFSAVFELNNNADLINKWFGRTVTYSDARFSYEEAQHIIEAKDLLIPKEIALTKKQYKTTNSIKEAILK